MRDLSMDSSSRNESQKRREVKLKRRAARGKSFDKPKGRKA